jgi:hypothetical protein
MKEENDPDWSKANQTSLHEVMSIPIRSAAETK